MTDSTRPTPLLVLDVVGLTPRLLKHMPRLSALADAGWQAELGTVLPAVTCSVQATFTTGTLPRDHGIVGNGWYFRELGEVFLWRQHNRLVQGENVWEAARKRFAGYRTANVCWWYAMGMTTDYVVTPRPIYFADGKKEADCYTYPPELHDELTTSLGTFPLFSYWGANANITSSRWIIQAARRLMPRVDLTMVYLPHLDYDPQRFGPDAPETAAAARELDAELAPLLEDAKARGVTVVALSEYGITNADRPVDINRALRREGLLNVYTQAGMEYLDPWTSRAFAVSDHQVAHVYVKDEADLPAVRALCEAMPGVAEVLDRDGQSAYGIDHERAGELVLVAEPKAWFTYYYWLDDAKAPDWARGVEIHKKPGYDPAELFLDPEDPLVKAKAGVTLLKKKAGLRYRMSVVPLDPAPVKGSHGRLPDSPDDGPVLIVSDASAVSSPDRKVEATEVKSLLLRLAGLPDSPSAH
jgi:predicted AlkP superfamily pyrophosphatase or phosphodiesterase